MVILWVEKGGTQIHLREIAGELPYSVVKYVGTLIRVACVRWYMQLYVTLVSAMLCH